jgi:hypothetical protein
MTNKSNALATEAIDFTMESRVHIAGVSGSSPLSPTTFPKENQYVRPRAIQCAKEQAYHIKRIRELFAYEPEEGVLYRIKASKRAGRKTPAGYYIVSIDGVTWREHRIIWEWVHGQALAEDYEIDHIDGDRGNNRIENLRKVSRRENQWNAQTRKDNTSGYKGVSWHKKSQRWAANISIDGKVKCLGMYDTPEEAHAAYCQRASEIRGEFARFR